MPRQPEHARCINRPAHSAQAAALAILLAVASTGCDRGVDSGATSNPVAPGRPGTGNGTDVVMPQPTSPTESPQVGGNRAAVPAGVTGSGGVPAYPGTLQGSESTAPIPGGGLQGGLRDGSAIAQPDNRRIPDRLDR